MFITIYTNLIGQKKYGKLYHTRAFFISPTLDFFPLFLISLSKSPASSGELFRVRGLGHRQSRPAGDLRLGCAGVGASVDGDS